MIEEWRRCRKYLEPALDGSYELEDVWDEIKSGRAAFWPFPNGAVVTQVCEYPRRRVLRVWLAGGNLDELRRSFGFLDELAEELGCQCIEIDGRKGWGRVMDGFKQQRVVYTKEVNDGR